MKMLKNLFLCACLLSLFCAGCKKGSGVKPSAIFNTGGNNSCALTYVSGGEITFSVTNPQSDASYSWNFGDGNVGSSATVTHTYSQIGNYTATLTASNDGGTDTSSHSLVIGNPFSSGYFSSPYGPSANLASNGGNTFLLQGYPYYYNRLQAVITSGLNFSIPSQTINLGSGGTSTGTAHGHGYMVGSICNTGSHIYIVDTIVSGTGTIIVMDTLNN